MMNNKPNKGKGGRKNTFSDSFKVQIALEYLNGDYSYPQIANKYDLNERNVSWFVSWYRKNQELMTEEPEETENATAGSSDIKALEKKLALAEMKIAALEKVIAIANEDYGTDLKKKAATK